MLAYTVSSLLDRCFILKLDLRAMCPFCFFKFKQHKRNACHCFYIRYALRFLVALRLPYNSMINYFVCIFLQESFRKSLEKLYGKTNSSHASTFDILFSSCAHFYCLYFAYFYNAGIYQVQK